MFDYFTVKILNSTKVLIYNKNVGNFTKSSWYGQICDFTDQYFKTKSFCFKLKGHDLAKSTILWDKINVNVLLNFHFMTLKVSFSKCQFFLKRIFFIFNHQKHAILQQKSYKTKLTVLQHLIKILHQGVISQ